jgi:hypothetical protein
MSNPLNPPDSPPRAPVIPEGLGTKLGKYGTLLLLVAGAVTQFTDGGLDPGTKLFAILGTVVAVATILGRMLQSAAALWGSETEVGAVYDEAQWAAEDGAPLAVTTSGGAIPHAAGNPGEDPGAGDERV